ncbi:membrane hypothetical protein [Agrobacterium tumefaciens str. Kerr 14]|uniref:Uncharacterized protein n=2 Tax=Agrobacterium tumefaciens TaxID=358 RepID=A0A1S7SAU3_AGRTU|nr:membrane hypothetical protein [Agrobacterium tumefaciens str. Kerr 14]
MELPSVRRSSVLPKELSLRIWKLRKWVTFLQDHYLAGDAPFWLENQNAGPIHSVREDLRSIGDAIRGEAMPSELVEQLERDLRRVEKHFNNLETHVPFLFRFFWLIWTVPFIAWTLYLAVILKEWAQLARQTVVLSRTLSFAVSLMRYKKATGWIIFRFYVNRVFGASPSLIFYTIASRPRYRYLYSHWEYTAIVAGISCVGLLALSLWHDLWISALSLRSSLRRVRPVPSGPAQTTMMAIRDKLRKDINDLLLLIEDADISDWEKDHYLMVKRDTDRLLRLMDRTLPTANRTQAPRYLKRWKIAPVVLTTLLVALTLGSYFRYPWLMADSAGWGLWVSLRMISDWMRPLVSLDDMFRLFSVTVVGSIAVLPLTISLLVTNGTVLLNVTAMVLLTLSMIFIVNLFSNLIGTFFKSLGKKNWQGSFSCLGNMHHRCLHAMVR